MGRGPKAGGDAGVIAAVRPPRVRQALDEATTRLRVMGVATARPDAEWLLGRVLGVPRLTLYAEPRRTLGAAEASGFQALVERRAAGEPLQYLLGFEEFCGLRLRVTSDVLVPRPETEGLVAWALEVLASRPRATAADVGTGSGAIACALASGHSGVRLVALDRSSPALQVAADNVASLGLASRIALVAGDGLDPLRRCEPGLDLVVANPPYLPTGSLASLPSEVVNHEPRIALDGGPDGMALARRLVAEAPRVLARGGALLMEIGEGQAAPLREAMAAAGLSTIEARRDLAGVERYLGGRRPGAAAGAERRSGRAC